MKEYKNNALFLRPRFSLELKENQQKLIEKFKKKLEESIYKSCSKVIDEHIVIDIPKEENHFWSPQLHLEVEERGEEVTLKGLFGPKPQVWTLFMFIHFIIATAFISFAIMVYVEISLGKDITFPLVMLVLLPIVWIVLYFLGQLGKETGKVQMERLQRFMLELIEHKE
ncbi:GTP-binding protein [Tenacibaculum maritimum]|uniref:GTP-binding protein n=1 Tax=Tenacibaculum maritimum TaxID=107401 RepID=UPI0012E5680A|nr:GTP-binding protein [Tenacibaculum maritimum]CAA0218444.1 conserved hypothetical membrane protein [Tenacibaculum maritimum]